MNSAKVLAFDTSAEFLSAGIFEHGKELAAMNARFFSHRSGALMLVVEELFKRCKAKWRDIEFIAVGVGPGSFTGLRVGVMTARMLASLSGKKVIAVDSLAIIAYGAQVTEGRVAVLRDAKKGRVYAALFEFKGGRMRTLQKTSLMDRNGFLARLAHPALVVEDADPQAYAIAKAAAEAIRKEKFTAPARLKPLYLHPKDCNASLPNGKATMPKK